MATTQGAFFWVSDGNEKDAVGAEIACDAVDTYLETRDLFDERIAPLLREIDCHVVPQAAIAHSHRGLALSLLVGRATKNRLSFGFAGEIRAHVLDSNGALVFATHEHNLFNETPRAIWEEEHQIGEEEAKSIVTSLIGSSARIELHDLPTPSSGSLVVASHLWHRYRDTGSYLDDLRRFVQEPKRLATNKGQAIAVIQW
jgi:hypothetical protein